MRSIFPTLKSKPRFPLDLSLLPIGIILLELSVTATELFKIHPSHTPNLLAMRGIHLLTCIVIVKIAKKILDRGKVVEVNYTQIFLLGVTMASLAEIARGYLSYAFDVPLDYSTHRFLIVLVHGLFWIPIFIIVAGRLTDIFSVFNEYERRLLIKTRIQVRTSQSIKMDQENTQDRIRAELLNESEALLALLADSDQKGLSLAERNFSLQPNLKGLNLRALSLSLEKKSESDSEVTVFGQNLKSLSIFSKQFALLYKLTAKKSPLSPWVYTILSTVLVAAPYINFFTLKQMLASWPALCLATYLVARLNVKVLKSNIKHSIAISNLLIVLLGFLPGFANRIGQYISPNPDTNFSFVLSGYFFAFGYYIYIRFLQITQPEAISSISSDELEAGPALQSAVSKMISQEFTQSLSHRWAIFIHGKILTRLAAASLKLEQAVLANDEALFDAGIERIKTLLTNPTREFDQDFNDLQTEVASRLDPWDGLISISVRIDPSLHSITNSRVRDCGEAIEEIVSNSVRHGGSQNISVDVTQIAHPDVQIKVEDDAINPLPLVVSRVGLGTRIFNLVSDGRWTINHEGQKTTFIMTMSLLED